MMTVSIVFWFALNNFNWNVFCLAEEGIISCHTCLAKQFRWLRNCTSAWDWLEPGPFAHTHWIALICIEWFQLNGFCLAEERMISCHTYFAKRFGWLRNLIYLIITPGNNLNNWKFKLFMIGWRRPLGHTRFANSWTKNNSSNIKLISLEISFI